jgi:PHD/YefM family antitoxin component YafN of YafNO toxin-antitoxin module
MITNDNIVSISQMRKETDEVLKKISAKGRPVYLFSRSRVKAVLLDPEHFAKMQEVNENYLDQQELLSVDEAEISGALDWDKVKAKLK